MSTYIRLTSPPHIDGCATVTRHWHDLSGIERRDLIQDWIGLLTELYDAEMHAAGMNERYVPHALCQASIKYEKRNG